MISTPGGYVPSGLDWNAPPELHKEAVDPIRVCRRLDGETLAFTKISRVCGRRGATEATQYQVMVIFVTCVPYRHVLEQTTVCAQDVTVPGSHVLSSAAHAPNPAILQKKLVSWEYVSSNVFKTRHGKGCLNILIPLPSLWCCKVGVKISGHQHRAPLGPLADVRDDVLYC